MVILIREQDHILQLHIQVPTAIIPSIKMTLRDYQVMGLRVTTMAHGRDITQTILDCIKEDGNLSYAL